MKLLIIFTISAVLLQYHFATTAPGGSEHQSHPVHKRLDLPKELSNYKLLNKRFDGGVSDVELAQNKQTGKEVVIKITSKIKAKGSQPQHAIQEIIQFAKREADILEYLPHHQNVVQFEKFVETNENVYLVMEYASGGNVYDYLVKHGKMDENTARIVFKQVVDAVHHCHEHGVAHRDLKTENLLFDSNYNIKLADFGFAIRLMPGETLKDRFGTPNYRAPEMWNDMEYDGFETDIWAIGGILYELVCGPIHNENDPDLVLAARVYKGNAELSFELSENYKDLIHKTLAYYPKDRLPIEQIKEHPWMKMGGSNTQSGWLHQH